MPYTPVEKGEEWPAYHEQRGRFAGASKALNPPEPQRSQQPATKPRRWQVGDLINNLYTGINALVIGVRRNSLDMIDVSGCAYTISREEANTGWTFCQHSYLLYEADTIQKAESDFAAGLFTPNFNLLS